MARPTRQASILSGPDTAKSGDTFAKGAGMHARCRGAGGFRWRGLILARAHCHTDTTHGRYPRVNCVDGINFAVIPRAPPTFANHLFALVTFPEGLAEVTGPHRLRVAGQEPKAKLQRLTAGLTFAHFSGFGRPWRDASVLAIPDGCFAGSGRFGLRDAGCNLNPPHGALVSRCLLG